MGFCLRSFCSTHQPFYLSMKTVIWTICTLLISLSILFFGDVHGYPMLETPWELGPTSENKSKFVIDLAESEKLQDNSYKSPFYAPLDYPSFIGKRFSMNGGRIN